MFKVLSLLLEILSILFFSCFLLVFNFFRFGYSAEKLLFIALKAFEGTYDEPTIRHWLSTFLRRFFTQQFKRSCIPDGPKVGSVSLSPRGDWRMPSDIESPWGL